MPCPLKLSVNRALSDANPMVACGLRVASSNILGCSYCPGPRCEPLLDSCLRDLGIKIPFSDQGLLTLRLLHPSLDGRNGIGLSPRPNLGAVHLSNDVNSSPRFAPAPSPTSASKYSIISTFDEQACVAKSHPARSASELPHVRLSNVQCALMSLDTSKGSDHHVWDACDQMSKLGRCATLAGAHKAWVLRKPSRRSGLKTQDKLPDSTHVYLADDCTFNSSESVYSV